MPTSATTFECLSMSCFPKHVLRITDQISINSAPWNPKISQKKAADGCGCPVMIAYLSYLIHLSKSPLRFCCLMLLISIHVPPKNPTTTPPPATAPTARFRVQPPGPTRCPRETAPIRRLLAASVGPDQPRRRSLGGVVHSYG